MSTYSNAPTRSWQFPAWSPWAVLLTTLTLVAVGWSVLAPGPDGRLAPVDVDGAWPFADEEVEVYCQGGNPTVNVDGDRYALSDSLRGSADLRTFDLDLSDDVWLRRDGGTKVPLAPVTEAAQRFCDAGR